MPELPEVETIRRQLAPHLEGRTIERAEILDFRWTRPDPPEPVAHELTGAFVEQVNRRGKYLVWTLSGDRYLLAHLRMTGSLLFDPAVDPPHTRVRLQLDGGRRLIYVDPRRFGTGHLVHGAAARDRVSGRADRSRTAHPRIHDRVPAGRRSRPDGAGQGVPARPAAPGGRRQHLRGRGSVPGRHPSVTAGRAPHRGPARAAALRDRGGAAGRDRRKGSLDRRLPSRRRRPRILPGPVPRPHPRRRAMPDLRDRDREARGRGEGYLRVPALPAAPAAQASSGSPTGGRGAPRPRAARAACLRCRRRRSSSKPPIVLSPIRICGNVYIPVRLISSARPSGSRAKLISS